MPIFTLAGVGYEFTTASSGTVVADALNSDPHMDLTVLTDMIGSTFDTVLLAVAGTPGSFAQVACGDDVGGANGDTGNSESRVVFLAHSGTTYCLVITVNSSPVNNGAGSSVFHLNFDAADNPPFGSLDAGVNTTNGTATVVAAGGSITVLGWAAVPEDGAPVSRVAVPIDGVGLGDATLGGSRTDVASVYGKSIYANSGWTLTGSIGSISAEAHLASAVAYDSSGVLATIGTSAITVTAP